METSIIQFDNAPPQGINFMIPFAEELARKIGWNYELDTSGAVAYVKNPVSNMRFRFLNTGPSVEIYNGFKEIGGEAARVNIPRDSMEKIYKMFILQTGEGTVSIGFGKSTTIDPELRLIIAKNMNGEYVGLQPKGDDSATGNNSKWFCLRDMASELLTFIPAFPTSDAIESGNTAIFKMPDIFGGCMFRDIYGVWSCPRSGRNRKLYINGVIYRVLSAPGDYGGIAIPDINN